MTNAPALLRSLIIYAMVLPLALLVGYLLSDPTLILLSVLAFIVIFPLLVRFHYPWMLFGWSATMILFFIKATPNLGLAMIALSLTLSILERIMNPQRHFVRMPS